MDNLKDCGYKKALEKIKKDSKFKSKYCVIQGPTGPKGDPGPATIKIGKTTTGNPGEEATVINTGTDGNATLNFKIPMGVTGPKGDMGPKGDTGPTLLRTAYLVTFNKDSLQDGVQIVTNGRIPIDRSELDLTNLITLDTSQNTIKFNTIGCYRITFTISAYPSVTSVDFDPTTDIVSVGFKKVGTNDVYVGVGEWVFNGEAIELFAQGLVSIVNTTDSYELVNLSKETIYLNTPALENINSTSYFSNSLVTIVIDYLGRQEGA